MIHEKTMPMYGVTHMIEAKDRKDMKKDRQGWSNRDPQQSVYFLSNNNKNLPSYAMCNNR